jgi:hypothetical protein
MLNAESTGNSTLCELTVVDFNNKEIPLKVSSLSVLSSPQLGTTCGALEALQI